MCQVGIAPSIAQYETEDIIEAVVDLAEEYDIMVHGHLAESQHEVEYTLKTWGCRPLNGLRDTDFLERDSILHIVST